MLLVYNFKITYYKGSENSRADALSRRPDYRKDLLQTDKLILKEQTDSLKYNYKKIEELLATKTIVEDS